MFRIILQHVGLYLNVFHLKPQSAASGSQLQTGGTFLVVQYLCVYQQALLFFVGA
ncbi:hypothetical protein ACFL5B_01505 [Candidatus Latescibacterota bacterium]